MKRASVAIALTLLVGATANAGATDRPQVTHYSLRLQLFPKESNLEAGARLTVSNTTRAPQTEIPFLLYRLLEVRSVGDEEGELEFSQAVVKDADEPNLQMNLVRVRLRAPLPPGESTTILINYRGSVFGYPEVWAYVRDTVAEEYSLLRVDSFSYPVLAGPSQSERLGMLNRKFTYDLQVTVPADYVVATGGRPTGTRSEGPRVTFSFASRVPTWRMDIAAARFKMVSDGNLAAYVLPEHESGGRNVLVEMKRVVSFYSQRFGELENHPGYTAIEIPGGWGSQAAEFYFLQTAAAFTDPSRIGEVYHEIAHGWNARPKPEVQRCRWFDEAFASYLEALAVREFQGQEAFAQEMEQARTIFLRWVEADRRHFETPIADYGKYEMGGLSYTKGAWSLYVLHELIGEDSFRELVRRLRTDFGEQGVDFGDFQRLAEELAKRSLKKYFEEWFFSAESSRLLADNLPLKQIVARYR